MKRLMDLALAFFALIALTPVFLLAAAAIMLESGGPILYRQTRVGVGGRTFGMYKFRSMVVDAEERGPYFTSQDDPRITRTGRILRRTSVDELPQLLNVLAGDMSLVGPRPDVPAQESLYSVRDWACRCSVRPGITGLAQVLYRSESTPEQRLEADLQYVREIGVVLDLKIMWWTVGRLTGRGSN